jgi:hypothetical protein
MLPIIFAQDEFTENSPRLKSVKVSFSPTTLAQATVFRLLVRRSLASYLSSLSASLL